MPGRAQRLVPWLVRALWAALPFTVGPTLAEGLEGTGRPVQVLCSLGLWTGWAAGVLASAVPHPVALTTLRLVAPAAAVAVVAAAVADDASALAGGWAVVVLAWCYSPAVGAHWVNGPAYPNERRYLLRAPGPLLAGPLALAWALAAGGACAGPLLLAARQWVAGGLVSASGLPLAVVLVRAPHNLSRRWAVFVPAGLVLHDPLTLLDPVLFRRQTIAVLRPAPATSDGLDLTQKAPGLALELALTQAVSLTLVRPGQRLGDPQPATKLLFTPTRPGALLDDARSRRIRVD